ncbi:uncharacterized protein [Hemitrygon akajei]|uniref:uncharacterized protein isoform X1 n=2 Tax=Hemitrygon akajei TaxID=2704970 RepID=UPI003BF982E3
MEKYEAAMVLGALGNAIGYHNVTHECYKAGLKLTESDLLAEIDTMVLKSFQWRAPLDTLMHMATAEALASAWDSIQELCNQAAKRHLLVLHTYQNRHLQAASEGAELRTKIYSSKGCTALKRKEPKFGAAARTMCIGMCYSKAEQLNDLLQASIECGRMTHSYPAGFLGSFCTALFTSFAIQGKPIAQWGWRMMELMPTAEQYCERKMKHFSDYRENWFSFETKWQLYLQQRGIEKNGSDKAIFPKTYNIEERNKLFRRWHSESTGKDKGLETTLIAYDALLFAGSDWEKLCYSAMFHRGESAVTGAIAGSLYGILFGFDSVPLSLYQNLEFRGHLELLGRQLYYIATTDRSLCHGADCTQRDESIDVCQIARTFVNKRTSDEINNLINYIAHLEKVKKTSADNSVGLTNIFATKQNSVEEKASKTEGKLRPTRFQLLQSRFTKTDFQNKLEKLELPVSKTKTVSGERNTAADVKGVAENLPIVDKRDTNFTEMHNGLDLMAEQKHETPEVQKVDGNQGKPTTENDASFPQPHSTGPEFSMVDNFTKMHKTIDLGVQQECEPAILNNEDTTLKQSTMENSTTELCSNSLESTGKQVFLTDKSNDTFSESAGEANVDMQLDSSNENKVTLPEPSVQTVAEILYSDTEIPADKLTKLTIHNEIQTSNKNGAISLDQKHPPHKLITGSSFSSRDTNEVIDFPHSLLQTMKSNMEGNPPQTVKGGTEETTKPSASSLELFSDTSKKPSQKNTSLKLKDAFSTGIPILPNDKRHENIQGDEEYKLLHQSNQFAIDDKDHNAMTKGLSPQTLSKKVESSISEIESFKPIVYLSENKSMKEATQNSEPDLSKIPIFPQNRLIGKKEDNQRTYNEDQCLQIQNINTEKTASSQIGGLQPFTDSCEKQKLKKIQHSSESASSTRTQTPPETESKEEERGDNQYRNIFQHACDSVSTAVSVAIVQEQQPLESQLEIAEATISQARNPESHIDLYKKQKLQGIPPRLQPDVTTGREGGYPGICCQTKESVNVAEHYGDEQEPYPAVEPNTEGATSAWNQCTSPTASCKTKSWKYKAHSYADTSVTSKSNRRVLLRATDVIQISSPPLPSFSMP